ncbi:hypothetical protein O181_046288 [Austropuccinia psidii MF-1]|uniref:DUF4939 domain-containing protein n=1 Tax=Austropuccinia psidii MF-1 TaxID=1389203 RepID=A0A9Q3HIE5_9BASI|nr:hypothetical protein [Austropuccinia psidii MF-1]
MPAEHSVPERQTRAQAVLTPTPRVPLDGTPEVAQLRPSGPFPGITRTILKVPGEDDVEEEESSVQGEASNSTAAAPTPVGASEGTEWPLLAQCNQHVSHQSEPSLLDIIQQMTQTMAHIQAASSSEASRRPTFKNTPIKEPNCFDGTQKFKLRSFIKSLHLIFHNDKEGFSQYRKKVYYSTSFLIGRAEKWIEPYLSNLSNEDPA